MTDIQDIQQVEEKNTEVTALANLPNGDKNIEQEHDGECISGEDSSAYFYFASREGGASRPMTHTICYCLEECLCSTYTFYKFLPRM